MNNIITFLLRYSGLVFFLVLESICMYLAVQNNKRQKEIYINSANTYVGWFSEQRDDVTKYFQLNTIADSLAAENARLYSKVGNTAYSGLIQRDSMLVKDSLDHVIQQYSFISAAVINNSVAQYNNYLTLNRGSSQGIQVGMGVISANGVVGVVRSVSPHFALVMSALHQQTKISASIKRNDFFGSLVWKQGTDPQHLILEAIPKHADLVQGDTIVTSGYSNIFPKGIKVGRLEDFSVEGGSNFYKANVRLFEDFSRIRYVYVVNNLFSKEQENLENQGEK
jgi:rod shape-determining protein MreC